MNKFVFGWIFTILIMVITLGCSIDTNPTNDEYIDPSVTNVVIKLPQDIGRIALDVARQSTYYEAFLVNASDPTEVYSAHANITDGEIRLLIPAGTFNILLLAGVYDNPNNIIYGSCTITGISISYDVVTRLSLPMKAFSLTASTYNGTEIEVLKTSIIGIDSNIEATFAFILFYVELTEIGNTSSTNAISITPTRDYFTVSAKVTSAGALLNINRLYIGGENGIRTSWIVRDVYDIPVKAAVVEGTVTWD